MDLFDEVKKLLSKSEISQRELARIANVSYHDVKALKANRLNHVSILAFGKIMKVLGYRARVELTKPKFEGAEQEYLLDILYPKERLEKIRENKPRPARLRHKHKHRKEDRKEPTLDNYEKHRKKFAQELKAREDVDSADLKEKLVVESDWWDTPHLNDSEWNKKARIWLESLNKHKD